MGLGYQIKSDEFKNSEGEAVRAIYDASLYTRFQEIDTIILKAILTLRDNVNYIKAENASLKKLLLKQQEILKALEDKLNTKQDEQK